MHLGTVNWNKYHIRCKSLFPTNAATQRSTPSGASAVHGKKEGETAVQKQTTGTFYKTV